MLIQARKKDIHIYICYLECIFVDFSVLSINNTPFMWSTTVMFLFTAFLLIYILNAFELSCRCQTSCNYSILLIR